MIGGKLLSASAAVEPTFIEDVFSTYLYTGTGAPQTIINNIPLSNFGVGTSTKFTGSQNLYRGDLVGNSDGKSFTFSAWIKLNTANGAIYSSDSTGSGVGFNVLYVSSQLRLRAYNSSGVEVASFDLSGVPFGVFFNLLISVDLTNSSNRYVYINDVAQTITWSTYTNTDIDFTRPDQRVGVRGTDYPLNGNLAHVFLDYTYRNLSVEANRRSFITANKGSTSVASLSALNPIVYLPLVSPYTFGQNLGTGGAFSVSGTPTFVNEGTEYVDGTSEGGLVWQKSRTNAAYDHNLFDTARGVTKRLLTNTILGELTETTYLTAFNANGFSVGSDAGYNQSGAGIVTWTFRKAPRFFDVVTYTGTGSARTIAHNLGVVPGCIIVKCTSSGTVTFAWNVYHRSLSSPAASWLLLNSTNAVASDSGSRWNNTLPTSSVFSVNADDATNASGQTYVAYLFAHDPLGPSGDGSDGLIACGSYVGAGTTNRTVTLGWEPQWVLIKKTTTTGNWQVYDNMRGMDYSGQSKYLFPNLSNAESAIGPASSGGFEIRPTPTGFELAGDASTGGNHLNQTYIYIAIRRGPMREPTVGTQVFAVDNGDGSSVPAWTSGFPVDMAIERSTAADDGRVASRFTSGTYLITNSTATETANSARVFDYMNGWLNVARSTSNYSWMFRRAPGFFDVVAYTGDGTSNRQINHNLGVVPELVITKIRSGGTGGWWTRAGLISQNQILRIDQGGGFASLSGNADTSTTFNSFLNNSAGTTNIAYLFASLPGISKVGSYTGNGSSQTINCGFTTGARFILIKRTDSTGDWYVWDTARGIVTGNDPHLSLNTTDAQVTTDDTIDPDNSGFIVNQVAATNVNVNAASYIYMAIA